MKAPIHGAMQAPTLAEPRLASVATHPRLDPNGKTIDRPTCWRCTRALKEHRGDVLGVVRVERAIVLLDTSTREYRVIVHCHGQVAIVVLASPGDDMPEIEDVRRMQVFGRRPRHTWGEINSSDVAHAERLKKRGK